jgi:hypothetical protein
MRKSYTKPIGEVIKESLKDLNIDQKLKEVHVINSWDKFVGKTVAKATKGIYIKDKKLFLKINSSVIRNELLIIKKGIIKRINEFNGGEIINDIIIR